MSVELAGANVVVAARQFNPSVFSQLWLGRNGIVAEDDFLPGCLFSDQAVNVVSPSFGLLVVPPQLQFVPALPVESQRELIVDKVGMIVDLLPHTPYVGAGLNFFYHLRPDDGDVPALTRLLFYNPERPLSQFFQSSDARFGVYFSKDFLDCRLKLDVKPIVVPDGSGTMEVVQFAFNFHLDVPPDGSEPQSAIKRHLQNWDDAAVEAKGIVESLNVGEQDHANDLAQT
jgi:hypothetical protein